MAEAMQEPRESSRFHRYTIRILFSVSAERQIPVLRQGDPKFELSLGCVTRLCFNNRNYSLKTIDHCLPSQGMLQKGTGSLRLETHSVSAMK